MNPLLQAMMQAAQRQAPQGKPNTASLARAMSRRRDGSLPALPAWREQNQPVEATRGGNGNPSGEAFQQTAFDNDAYQVF